MYHAMSNILFFLVIVLIGLTGYSFFSGKVVMIPYIQFVFAAVLIVWGVIEYMDEGKKFSFFYFGLALIAGIAGIYNMMK